MIPKSPSSRKNLLPGGWLRSRKVGQSVLKIEVHRKKGGGRKDLGSMDALIRWQRQGRMWRRPSQRFKLQKRGEKPGEGGFPRKALPGKGKRSP